MSVQTTLQATFKKIPGTGSYTYILNCSKKKSKKDDVFLLFIEKIQDSGKKVFLQPLATNTFCQVGQQIAEKKLLVAVQIAKKMFKKGASIKLKVHADTAKNINDKAEIFFSIQEETTKLGVISEKILMNGDYSKMQALGLKLQATTQEALASAQAAASAGR